jgi:hypothetical protein
MEKRTYEVPELSLIGAANEIVMGLSIGIADTPSEGAPDFEFEQG